MRSGSGNNTTRPLSERSLRFSKVGFGGADRNAVLENRGYNFFSGQDAVVETNNGVIRADDR